MVRGHLSPRFLPLDAFVVSISRLTEWGGGALSHRAGPYHIGPRYNIFPGPAVALDGPGARGSKVWCSDIAIDNAFTG